MKGVTLQFDEKTILNGVDLTLKKEEALVIMGLSGCGKSTLLKILMGLLQVNSGSVLFKNDEITKISRSQLNQIRSHIGMVYQNAALISSMNVRDNIALPLMELTKKTPKEIDLIVDQKLELVGLKETRDKIPSELSGGMQKRVGLARALVMEPELVLFDEPSAGLDPINSKLILDLIVQLREHQKVTSIVVTHEMQSAFAVATTMAFLHEGKIILHGTPDEFKASKNSTVIQFITSYSNHDQPKK